MLNAGYFAIIKQFRPTQPTPCHFGAYEMSAILYIPCSPESILPLSPIIHILLLPSLLKFYHEMEGHYHVEQWALKKETNPHIPGFLGLFMRII